MPKLRLRSHRDAVGTINIGLPRVVHLYTEAVNGLVAQPLLLGMEWGGSLKGQ